MLGFLFSDDDTSMHLKTNNIMFGIFVMLDGGMIDSGVP